MKASKCMVRVCEGNVLVDHPIADVLCVPIIACNLSKKLDLCYMPMKTYHCCGLVIICLHHMRFQTPRRTSGSPCVVWQSSHYSIFGTPPLIHLIGLACATNERIDFEEHMGKALMHSMWNVPPIFSRTWLHLCLSTPLGRLAANWHCGIVEQSRR